MKSPFIDLVDRVPDCAVPDTHAIAFIVGRTTIMRLDEQGMTYKGQRVDDAGEAHRAFLEMIQHIKNVP